MCKVRLLVGVVWGLLFCGLGLSQQPDKVNSEQKEKIQQRNRLLAEAQQLQRASELEKAIAAAEKMLALDRDLFGKEHVTIASSLRLLGRLHEARDDLVSAGKVRKEAVAMLTRLLGPEHWQVTNARLELTSGEDLAKLAAGDREQLRQATTLHQRVLQLYGQGQHREALPLAQEVVAVRKKLLGDHHPHFAASLTNLALLYEAIGDSTKALPLLEQARDLSKKLHGENNLSHAESLNNLALAYESLGDYQKALPLLEQACALTGKMLGDKHPHHASILGNLAGLYKTMGAYAKALPLYEQIRDLKKQQVGENHLDYAQSLDNLAGLYKAMGEYPKALSLYEQARALYKKLSRDDHPDSVRNLHNLAGMYQSMGDYAKALPLSEQALALRKKVLGENHPAYAQSLSNLAVLYKSTGDYSKALPLFEQARDLRKKLLGENHPDYANTLNNLGLLYEAMGDYAKALPLYEQARDLRKKVLGENHPDYATSLNNLASFYLSMGDNPKALPLYEQARDLRKKVLGENHPDYATSLSNLGLLYLDRGDYPKAMPLLEQARDLRKKLLGENHPDHATSLNNLAATYQGMGEYAKALPLYERALELRKKVLGENHPNYAAILNNLGWLYQSMGNYQKALPTYVQASNLTKRALGENHPNYADSLNNLATLYQAMDDDAAANRTCGQAFEIYLRLLQETFDVVGERQRLQHFQSMRMYLGNYVLTARHARVPAAQAYAVTLKWKGTVVFRQSLDLLLRDQPTLASILNKLHSVRTQLAKAAFEAPAPAERESWEGRLRQLHDDKERLEAELARASKTFRSAHRPPPSLAQVQQGLPQGSALIDLLVYRRWVPPEKRKDKNKEEREDRLVAFVVRPDQDVQMVFVDDLKSLETLIEGWRQAVSANNPAAQAEAARQIKQQLWQPLEKHLGTADTVLISADGPLLRFPFAALPGKHHGTYLLEDVAIGYVTSGRQVVDLLQPANKDLTPPAGLLALGGVDYGSSDAKKQVFLSLPGTDLEAVGIREQFRKRFPEERTTALLGQTPTRGKVVAEINQRYRYLHLATHGFFESPERIAALRAGLRASESGLPLEQRSQRDDILAFLPLLKSGLVLAGANKSEGDESLLTAEDVSGLDLRGTDLVVLSACETSLGNLTQGDGVLGLQRGFHAGGARTLVSSLWSVNDAATSVLMEEFYHNLWRKEKPLSKLEALRQAQLFVLKNPERVLERSKDLRAQLAKRGLPEDSLRGPKGNAVKVIDDGKGTPDSKRSPTAWWAAFVLSGETGETKK